MKALKLPKDQFLLQLQNKNININKIFSSKALLKINLVAQFQTIERFIENVHNF